MHLYNLNARAFLIQFARMYVYTSTHAVSQLGQLFTQQMVYLVTCTSREDKVHKFATVCLIPHSLWRTRYSIYRCVRLAAAPVYDTGQKKSQRNLGAAAVVSVILQYTIYYLRADCFEENKVAYTEPASTTRTAHIMQSGLKTPAILQCTCITLRMHALWLKTFSFSWIWRRLIDFRCLWFVHHTVFSNYYCAFFCQYVGRTQLLA